MRVIHFISITFLLVLFSCGGKSPETAIKGFYSAMKVNDIDKAKSFTTSSSHSYLNMINSGMDISLGDGEIVNIDCVIENDEAECDCFFEGNQKPVPVSVLMENGEWKVDFQTTAKDMMYNVLDKFKDIDLNSLMEKFGDGAVIISDKINELINNIDVDKVVETISGLDSNMTETGGSLEKLINQVKEGLNKIESNE
ncbi:MAG: hypothetical protein ABF294_03840 [Flavobacteriales bacterium]